MTSHPQHLLLWLLCAACFAVLSSGKRELLVNVENINGVAIVITQDFYDKPPERIFFLRQPNGDIVELQSNNGINLKQEFKTGQKVTASGTRSSNGGRSLIVASLSVDEESPSQSPPATARAYVAQFQDSMPAAASAALQEATSVTDIAPRPNPMREAQTTEKIPVSKRRAILQTTTPSTSALPVTEPNMRTLFLPISFSGCKKDAAGTIKYAAPTYTQTGIKTAVFWDGSSRKLRTTLEGMVKTCSYGKTSMSTSNSVVAPMISIPCPESIPAPSYALNSCNWLSFAPDYAVLKAKEAGIDVSQFPYRTVIFPSDAAGCGFAGAGVVACDPGTFFSNSVVGEGNNILTDCITYVKGSYSAQPNTYMHEMGHCLGLAHSANMDTTGTITSEYGDGSSAMSTCCTSRCYNQPHSWQLGWTNAQQLAADTLAPGTWKQFTLNSLSRSTHSGMRILTGSWFTGGKTVYLGYRLAENADADLSTTYTGRTNIYLSDSQFNKDNKNTGFVGSITTGGTPFQLTGSGLVIKQISTDSTNGRATLSVCRPWGTGVETATSCTTGIDADCDGLIGANDPHCPNYSGVAKPPPPPPVTKKG